VLAEKVGVGILPAPETVDTGLHRGRQCGDKPLEGIGGQWFVKPGGVKKKVHRCSS
jgi:hypothetical protein